MTSIQAGKSLLPPEVATGVGKRLVEWAENALEPLPWRVNRTPYRVWVSEIMLQQTRRETVVRYYDRFLERFPTVQALAAAELQDVLKAWEGMGYYARARALHAAAKRVVDEFGGQLPSDRRTLLSLPGIGAYTAGAILSIAFGQNEPVLDGNVKRVLCRLALVREDPGRPTVTRDLWATAQAVLVYGQAGCTNEALMELGAKVCLPTAPRCGACPVAGLCRAHREGMEEEVPVRSPKAPLPHYDVTAAVTIHGERALVAQRNSDDLLGGLWEFPGGTREEGETLEECLHREIREELGIEIEVGPFLVMVPHAFTHFRISLYAYLCRLAGGEPRALHCADWRWVTLDEVEELPMSVTDRRILQILREKGPLGELF